MTTAQNLINQYFKQKSVVSGGYTLICQYLVCVTGINRLGRAYVGLKIPIKWFWLQEKRRS